MEYQTLTFDVADSVATITLNRPDQANGLNLEMSKELSATAIRCDEDPDIRAVVITGSGRFFCAGGDLKAFAAAGAGVGSLIKEMTLHFHGAISRLSRMNAPIVAAINGIAAGAGFSLAAACDLAIAAESAQFVSAYTAASLSPDGSSTYFVPRLVGIRRATELMLTNRRLSATEALDWGLINRVVPDDQLLETVRDMARGFATGATLAYGEVKRMLHASLSSTLETQMELEARTIADLTRTHDAMEGIHAFIEKREPRFRAE